MELKITKTTQSRINEYDLDNVPFGQVFTDHMFVADYDGVKWYNFEIKPVEKLILHPGNLTFHYGQAIFEGMKAFKDADGNPILFRPEKHAQRINVSAARLCMPAIPEDLFVQALHHLVSIEKDWIPQKEGSALYIRPFMIATDAAIGVKPSKTYKFLILTLPVGPYYDHPVSLKVEDKYVRAVPGGAGFAKAAGNYAAALLPDKIAKAEGYDQVMWMDGNEFKYVQEVGTMNIFFVIGDTVITPPLNGAILDGVTRDSVIRLLRDAGHQVVERELSIDEIVNAAKEGELKEIFGTGTAAVVVFISHLSYKDQRIDMNIDHFKIASYAKKMINRIRARTIDDPYDWVVPVQVENMVEG